MIPLRFPKPDILRATEPDISFAPYTMPIRDWKAALNRFTIQFEDRMPQQ
jgi:transposase-like protein